jgi:TPR repeat protein
MWYLASAKQDFPTAQNNLGMMYEKGKGVPKDFKKAFFWYRKAAEQNLGKAQNNLALMYEEVQLLQPQPHYCLEKTCFIRNACVNFMVVFFFFFRAKVLKRITLRHWRGIPRQRKVVLLQLNSNQDICMNVARELLLIFTAPPSGTRRPPMLATQMLSTAMPSWLNKGWAHDKVIEKLSNILSRLLSKE